MTVYNPNSYATQRRGDKRARGECIDCSELAVSGQSRCQKHRQERLKKSNVRNDADKFDPVSIYDLLTSIGVDAAVFKLGDRCIVGRWLPTGVVRSNVVLRGKPKAVEVLGESDNWADAEEDALKYLELVR